MSQHFHPGTVTDIISEAPDVRRFFIEIGDTPQFRFKAGQYIILRVRQDSEELSYYFSIASNPGNDNIIELIVVCKDDDERTRFLFDTLQKESPVEVSDPQGDFSRPDIIENDLCFIATGTGISPLRSMILDILRNNIPHQHLTLIFGGRTQDELLYRNEFETLTRDYPEFEYIPVVSQGTWNGRTGRVHEVYAEKYAHNPPTRFYICGTLEMVRETEDNLLKLGYDRGSIFYQ